MREERRGQKSALESLEWDWCADAEEVEGNRGIRRSFLMVGALLYEFPQIGNFPVKRHPVFSRYRHARARQA